ncbi:hypothetical protein [Microbacterium suwonense]|uniref:hypothetical protein n=1 Tax=Microbacterium suwonense TaxID=683047 RepID=UPI002573ABFE|nr:hypothetical protein [Microbacterium suwonense]
MDRQLARRIRIDRAHRQERLTHALFHQLFVEREGRRAERPGAHRRPESFEQRTTVEVEQVLQVGDRGQGLRALGVTRAGAPIAERRHRHRIAPIGETRVQTGQGDAALTDGSAEHLGERRRRLFVRSCPGRHSYPLGM